MKSDAIPKLKPSPFSTESLTATAAAAATAEEESEF
jgi:hypothetical protein